MGMRSLLPTSPNALAMNVMEARIKAARQAERSACIAVVEQRGAEIGGAIQPARTVAAIRADGAARDNIPDYAGLALMADLLLGGSE